MSDDFPYKVITRPELRNSNLLVGWDDDAGKMGLSVTDYLISKLNCELFCEIEPRAFFPMNGVLVDNDVAQFPACNLYYSPGKNIAILRSSLPKFEWHSYLNIVLDIAERICYVNEVYTIGGMISVLAHTAPRTIMATMNTSRVRETLENYNIELSMNYETPYGQRPTMSSYLLWVARQRNITGISLWVPIPFYLVSVEDITASRQIIDFFSRRFSLGLDLSDLDKQVNEQNRKITAAIDHDPESKELIQKLESNVSLTEEDGQKLLKIIQQHLLST